MQVATAGSLIDAARQEADCETNTPTADFITDTEGLRRLTSAYRKLVDLIIENDGGDRLLTSAALTAPTYAVPSDFYRDISVDVLPAGAPRPIALERFNFRERGRYYDTRFPGWRVQGAFVKFYPTNAVPENPTLWYIADVAAISSTSTSLNVYNGWSDFVIADMAAGFLEKEERDPSVQYKRQGEAAQRIATAARQFSFGPDRIGDVARVPEDFFDLNW